MLNYSYKDILKVALPMMGSSFVQSVVLMTDSAFLSRYSTETFAAAGNAGLIFVTFFMLTIGISDGSQILISRKIGEQNYNQLGSVLRNSIFTLFISSIVIVSLAQIFMPGIMKNYIANEVIADYQIEYLNIRSFAFFGAMFYLPLQAYFYAWGKSWVPMTAAIITAITNIFLDYSMIFGHFGFPKMGLSGAAWASNIADFLGAIFLIMYLFISKEHLKHKLFDKLKIVKTEIFELLKLSLPIVLQGIISLSTWTIFFIWLEQKGLFEVTVSQNIRSIYFLAFVPIFGFASATKTYVSQYFGAGLLDQIPIIQRKIQTLSIIFMFVLFHGSILYPEELIKIVNPDEIYLAKSSETLRFASLSIFIYSFFNVYFQSINGIGKTKITFAIESLGVILYIISVYILIKVIDLDVKYVWSVEYIYFTSIGLLSFAYLKFSNWNKIS